MANYVIGTASGGYYNYRGANNPPYAFGSSVGLGAQHIQNFSIQLASNSGTGTVYGTIWNSAGNVVWRSGATSVGVDTSAPFGRVTWSPETYISDAYYFGFLKAAGSQINWDVVNGDNSTITGNDAIGTSGTGTIYRRLVGDINYYSVSVPAAPSVSSTPYNGGVTISFSSNGDGGEGIYAWQYSTDGSNWYGIGSNPFNVGGTNGVALTVYVRGVNVVGAGPAGSATSTPRTVPTAPQSFAASNSTFGRLALSWAAPASDGGESINGYRLRTGLTVGSGTVLYDGTATSFNHDGLSPYTDYSYNIVAYNDAGEGAGTTLTAKTLGGIGKVWNGTSYVTVLPKVWNGTAFVDAQARMWNGTEWKHGI